MNSSQEKRGPLRLGVLISGAGSTLANLIERIGDGRLPGVEIRLVVSSRQKVRGVEIAREAGLPLEIIRPKDFASSEQFSEAITQALDRAGVDLVVMGGFLCLWQLPPRYEGRVLNIHPALLPKFGGRGMYGLRVHEAVLAAGQTETGCTVHLVDREYDHGPVVAQRRVPVVPGDTPQTLAARVAAVERELYPEVIRRVAEAGLDWLKANARPQEPTADEAGR